MAVDQAPPRPPARQPNAGKLVRYDDYIDAKIESTRRLVKFVDFATALVELTVGVLLFLLVYALAEHWVVPGGFSVAMRMVLFALLVGSAGYFAYRRLWPLCVRAINPVYAAQTIEHGSPTLQNSLINLLLFRQRRSDISDAVYRTLEEQAAHGLTRVPIDSAVDRTQLIRLGYVLIAIVAAACLYKVLSPKDPLVAAERVLMPWADIVPASRVSISEVKPGVATISRGEFVDVTADVRGLDDDDAVVLRYTTDDGQVVGRAIPMKSGADRLQFSCRLADDSDGPESVGVTRSLSYRLEAGDARSLDYPITVVPAASILVERVDYHYPPYTGNIDRTVEGLGDIRAIEGTRVTVHARANGPIRDANVDFDADGRRDLQMTAAESKARVTFDLELREDRQTPRHASYVLRFTNDEGRANHDPVKHSIIVDRDFEPEAGIRQPQEKVRDVRLNELVAIEVEANDPDFALSAVRLRGEAAGRAVLDEALLKGQQLKRFAGQYKLTAGEHGLKPGDLVDYWVEASDNRTPKPNVAASEHKTLRVVSPNPAQQPNPNQIAQNDRQQPKSGEPQPGDEGQKNGKQNGNKQESGAPEQQPGDESGQGQGEQGQGQGQGQQGEQGQGGGKDQGKDAKGGGSGSGDKSQGNGENGEGQPNEGGKSGDGSASPNPGKGNEQKGQGQGGAQSNPGESGSNSQNKRSQGDQKSGDSQAGDPSKGGQPSKGGKPNAQQGEKSSGANQQPGEQKEQSGDNQAPVSSDGDNDAEAFDRIKKHMEQTGELKKEDASPADPNQESGPQENGQQGEGKQGEGQQGQDGKQAGEPKGEGKKAGDQRHGEKQNGKQGDQGQQGDKPPGSADKQGDQGSKSGSPDGKAGDDSKGDGQQQSGEGKDGSKDGKQDGSQGQNGQQPGDEMKQGEKGNGNTGQKDQGESPNGQQTGSKGEAGGGHDQKNQGAPKPEQQSGAKPGEKPEQSGSKGDKSKDGASPGGSNGKQKSDTHGEQGGDKTGDGEQGAGQKSPRDGTGSDGQNQSADNGAGESSEKGKGNNSPNAGKDAQSEHKTGSSDGKTPGEGSQQKDGAGDKPGGKAGDKDAAGQSADKPSEKNGQQSSGEQKPGDKQGQGDKQNGQQGDKESGSKSDQQGGKQGDKSADQPGDKGQSQQGEKGTANQAEKPDNNQQQSNDTKGDEGTNTGSANGAPVGGGQPGGSATDPSITGETPAGDAANLEYARKQTDLVLDKLSDQLKGKKPDDKLLKELGWSEAELRRFVERWQQRRDAANRNDPSADAAKRELDDALRSLGLQRDKLQQGAVKKDTMRDLQQGYRGPVPAEYQERLKAYNQGVSRARPSGE